MISNQNLKVKSGGSPCGCGGGSPSPSTGCKCGGVGCNMCEQQAFVRPRFFAGQLLTEDDLQLLGDYVIAKNRLHNRSLFGEGVVCGLEVSCQPCGGGSVIVHPGYAIDCCGNDITLSCAKPLDIIGMIRELRRRQLGYDCGDPCAEEKTPKKQPAITVKDDRANDNPNNSAASISLPGIPPVVAEPEPQPPPEMTRHYCLYIRYCEQLTDPVSPYSTGEACGAQACEPTRVREGVSFELRCREEGKTAETIFTRLCHCFGDLRSLERTTDEIGWHVKRAALIREAPAKLALTNVGAFIDALNQGSTALDNAVKILKELPQQTLSEAKADAIRSMTDAALNVASESSRFSVLTLQEQDVLNTSAQLNEAFAKTITSFQGARDAVVPHLPTLPSQLEQLYTKAVLGFVNAGAFIPPPGDQVAPQDMLIRFVNSPNLRAAAMTSFSGIREWLLNQLDKSPHLADCALRDEVYSVRLPGQGPSSSLALASARDELAFGPALAVLTRRYLMDCFCAALNPACQPCDDTAVLLACLEVKDCEIVRVCNLERTFVLSPAAIRYWFPPLQTIGEVFEQLCCPMPKRVDRTVPMMTIDTSREAFGDGSIRFGVESGGNFLRAVLLLLLKNFGQVCHKEPDDLMRVLGGIISLFRGMEIRSLAAPSMAEAAAVPAAETQRLSELEPALADQIKAMIGNEVRARVAEALYNESVGSAVAESAESTTAEQPAAEPRADETAENKPVANGRRTSRSTKKQRRNNER